MSVSWFDRTVFLLTMVSMTYACFTLWRASQEGLPGVRRLYAAMASLAAVYAVGYLPVIVGMVEPASWSAFFRPISLLSIWVVWVAPAVLVTRSYRTFIATFNATAEALANTPPGTSPTKEK